MSLHGTKGYGVSKGAMRQGSATAHTTLSACATVYPTAGSPPPCAASTTSRNSPSWRSERLRRRAPTRAIFPGGGGGREKIHRGGQNFNSVTGGQVSQLKKKHPKLKELPVGWGAFGDRSWG